MDPMSSVRLAVCVLLPFAAGYYLSYLFRSINALIAGDLTAELGLGAADLGLLTSVYFLVFAAVVLPCGVLLDRYGPRLIDSALLLLAAAGSLLFAVADDVVTRENLDLGRPEQMQLSGAPGRSAVERAVPCPWGLERLSQEGKGRSENA
jgi:MFS family permease